MFIGRIPELASLRRFKDRTIAGLAVIYGRRRVGKSTLIEHFAQNSRFLEFYGLSPLKCTSNQEQLVHFGHQMGRAFNIPSMQFNDWYHAISTLAGLTTEGEQIILLDEISWMSAYDKNLPSIIQGIWDTEFKKNPQLRLILCGSVSTWIEEKILKDKGYVGRVSLQMKLDEMPLYDANKFWMDNDNISATEKFKLLCVTGGIPRYLEEINIKLSAEENIKNMCYQPEGLLFNEFDTIFYDIFGKHDEKYREIVKALAYGSLEQVKLSEQLEIRQTGAFSDQLDALESAGFIKRDYVYNLNTGKAASSKYRLRDNYLRFYLKYVEPKRPLILNKLYHEAHLENLPEWHTVMELQFENLVLNNLPSIIKKLNIAPETIISAAPYFQSQTARRSAVQIDLLIHTQYTIFICEIKFRKEIGIEVIEQMIEKIKRLKIPGHLSVRPALIYHGKLSDVVKKSNYFSHIISFSNLLSTVD